MHQQQKRFQTKLHPTTATRQQRKTTEKAPSNAEENFRKTTCNEKTPVIKAPRTTIVIQKKKPTPETDTSNDNEIPRTEITIISPEMAKWTKLTTEKRSNINVSTGK
ncbi:hypothetical protein C2G38_2195192 [Gigaspora rosea]|uniref:Uncharacterized protein n=1 Tax=Gigaspora rosea TaxID=44941 RepID=A0A397UWB5_9GLOM|nr:hypothetical protein C2G38_2195192 [Gigaspora rosea]